MEMKDKRESKLQHIMKISWESDQMPGWKDSLSRILEATKKEFQLKNKDVIKAAREINSLEKNPPILELENEFSF